MVALIVLFVLLALIFYTFVIIAMAVLSIKSCISNTDYSPRYDYYDDRTPR